MRGKVLLEAHRVINGERLNTYGKPEQALGLIAEYWSIYLQLADPLTPKGVATMMALLKIARAQNKKYNKDDYVDCVGYMALANDMAEGEQ